ncbi:MAG: hypothetical protein C4525_03100 [Desulfarculus sp.]|nr:MAG: hypothetical protein C4525_03100 [Desulfarculus sp.]
MPELIIQAEYARRRGVSRAAVSKWVKRGLVPVDQETGKINPEAADAALDANRDPSRTPPRPPGPKQVRVPGEGELKPRELTDLTKARTVREAVKAQREKFELDKETGKLVRRQEVEDAAFLAVRTLRDQLRGMPAKLAPRLALADTPAKAAEILEAEITEHLEGLSAKFQKLARQQPAHDSS